jgi:hypothetical protein
MAPIADVIPSPATGKGGFWATLIKKSASIHWKCRCPIGSIAQVYGRSAIALRYRSKSQRAFPSPRDFNDGAFKPVK